MRTSVVISLAAIVALAAAALAVVAIRRRRRSSVHLALAVLAVAAALICVANTGTLVTTTGSPRAVIWKGVWLGVLAIGPAFVMFVATYVGVSRRRLRIAAWVSWIAAAGLFALLATNPLHHLVHDGFTERSDRLGYFVEVAEPRWPYVVMQLFPGVFAVIGSILWTQAYILAPRVYRGTLRLVAGAGFVPVLATVPLMIGFYELGNFLAIVGLVITLILLLECLRRLPVTTARNMLLRAARDRVVELMREGVIVVNGGGAVVDANPAAERLLGVSRLIGSSAETALPEWLCAILRRTAAGAETESLHHEVDGRFLDVTVTSVVDDDAAAGDRIVVVRDGTARARAERHLQTLVHVDSVTGLPNRVHLDLELTPRMADGETLAFMLLDLDGFRAVNDTYGHATGDDLLRETGKRLRQVLDPSVFIARLGGDEFAIVASCDDRDDAMQRAHEVSEAFSTDLSAGSHRVHIFASIGVAVAPEHATDAPSLMRCAEVAMYRAKRIGSRTAVYRPEDDVNTPERLQLVSDLRGAIARDELVLHYQPVLNLHTHHGVGCEALVRWMHPARGLLYPGEFLNLIDEAGLGRDFARWVATTAIDARLSWPVTAAGFQVAFNLSVNDLADRGFIDDLIDLVRASGLPTSEVVVEVTETVLLSHASRSEEHNSIDRLLAEGIRLVLDDFGTGHASVTTLRDMHGSVAKIAGVFVATMKDNPDDRSLVRGLTDLARSLDYSVLAEWIEDAETLAMVRDAGCRFGQGFFLARPMPSEDLAEWIPRFGPGGTDLPQPMMDFGTTGRGDASPR